MIRRYIQNQEKIERDRERGLFDETYDDQGPF